jgi:hypothetical protein
MAKKDETQDEKCRKGNHTLVETGRTEHGNRVTIWKECAFCPYKVQSTDYK